MRWRGHCVLALGFVCITQGPAQATPFRGETPEEIYNCSYSQVTGSFTAQRATYSLAGACISKVAIPWSAQGAYDEKTGQVHEKIAISGPPPYRGEFRLKMVCTSQLGATPFDPWLKNLDAKQWVCTQLQIEATGEIAQVSRTGANTDFVKLIFNRAQARRGPATISFAYDRQPLIAKRTNDLRAEAEAVAAEMRRTEQLLQGAKQPGGGYSALVLPAVLAPTAGQVLVPQRPVPIKLAPPKGWTVAGYTINIQRKDPNGNWVNHTTIPIGAAQAHSPTGYTGFGGGAPPAFLMLPGRWRLNVQASYPKKSGVSEWVEFSALESADFTAKKRKIPLPF